MQGNRGMESDVVMVRLQSEDEKVEKLSPAQTSAFSSIRDFFKFAFSRCYFWLVPLIVLAALLTLGLWAAFTAAATQEKDNIQVVSFVGQRAGKDIESQISSAVAPAQMLMMAALDEPYWPLLNATYDIKAKRILDLYDDGSVSVLELAPNGVCMGIYPFAPNTAAYKLDFLTRPNRRSYFIQAAQTSTVALAGPFTLVQGGTGLLVINPVFVSGYDEKEEFGAPISVSPCAPCYNNVTGRKVWGFSIALIQWNFLIQNRSGLPSLSQQGYSYQLWTPSQNSTTPDTLAASSGEVNMKEAVSVAVKVPNAQWLLFVSSDAGNQPRWKWSVVAAVIVGSFIFSIMLLFALVNQERHHIQLKETRKINIDLGEANDNLETTNGKLEELTLTLKTEQEATVQLVKRQYRLLQALGGEMKEFSSSDKNAQEMSQDISAVQNRILALRQKHFESMVKEGDDFVITKVLGEGGNGKVYKGIWKGTEVAIKSIMLPAHMSGKTRERMACMEAAISSSLSHPNIVQTYTYDILAIKDSGTTNSDSPAPLTTTSKIESERVEDEFVRSYEVRIILELCDLGSLRSFLNSGMFLSPPCNQESNTLALLDTAIDVARALSHLHAHQVIHGDLKTMNILLKRSATDPRGFIAKVSDFGLSQQIHNTQTHMSNLFQGTLTHMAPEVLLKGQVSFASDVYALGITLWELVTSSHPFCGEASVSLGHNIAILGHRPAWGPALGTPDGLKDLVSRCWTEHPGNRPSIWTVLDELIGIRAQLGGETPLMDLSVLLKRKEEWGYANTSQGEEGSVVPPSLSRRHSAV